MLYYSHEARESAIEDIKECIATVNEIPCNVLGYTQSSKIVKHLINHMNLIQKEDEEN